MGPRERFVLTIALTVLKAILPQLQKKAAETPSPIDDLILNLAQAMIPILEGGVLDELLQA